MTRYTLHVPRYRNDGTRVTTRELQRIEDAILNVTGAFTVTNGAGVWLGFGAKYVDKVALYATDSDEDVYLDLARIAQDVAERLGQECVYLTRQDITADLIYPAARTAARD